MDSGAGQQHLLLDVLALFVCCLLHRDDLVPKLADVMKSKLIFMDVELKDIRI